MNNELLILAKRVQAIAESGLHYTESDWDIDRYKDLEKIGIEMISKITNQPVEVVEVVLPDRYGYKTPKIDVRAVLINPNDEILLVKERVDSHWSMPGGWCDIGFTPSEVAEKEALEEAGINLKAGRLLALLDKKCHDHPEDLHYIYKIFIECSAEDYYHHHRYGDPGCGFLQAGRASRAIHPPQHKGTNRYDVRIPFWRLSWPVLDYSESLVYSAESSKG